MHEFEDRVHHILCYSMNMYMSLRAEYIIYCAIALEGVSYVIEHAGNTLCDVL